MSVVQVQIPAGVAEGQAFMIDVGGQQVQVVCPPGATAGATIQVPVPGAAPQPVAQPAVAAAPTAAPTAAPAMETVQVTVPEGAGEGSTIQIANSAGEQQQVQIPAGAPPGSVIQVQVPGPSNVAAGPPATPGTPGATTPGGTKKKGMFSRLSAEDMTDEQKNKDSLIRGLLAKPQRIQWYASPVGDDASSVRARRNKDYAFFVNNKHQIVSCFKAHPDAPIDRVEHRILLFVKWSIALFVAGTFGAVGFQDTAHLAAPCDTIRPINTSGTTTTGGLANFTLATKKGTEYDVATYPAIYSAAFVHPDCKNGDGTLKWTMPCTKDGYFDKDSEFTAPQSLTYFGNLDPAPFREEDAMGMMDSFMPSGPGGMPPSEEDMWKAVAKEAYIMDAHAYCWAFSTAGMASEHPPEEQFTSNPEDKKAVCEEVRYRNPMPRKTSRRALQDSSSYGTSGMDSSSSSSSSSGGGDTSQQNGEQACENNGYDETTCNNVGCCYFNGMDGQCWSAVGTSMCNGDPNMNMDPSMMMEMEQGRSDYYSDDDAPEGPELDMAVDCKNNFDFLQCNDEYTRCRPSWETHEGRAAQMSQALPGFVQVIVIALLDIPIMMILSFLVKMACLQPGGACFCRNAKGEKTCCTKFWLCVLGPIAKLIIYVFVLLAIVMLTVGILAVNLASSRLAFHYGDGFTSKYVPASGFVGTWFFSQMIAAIQQIFVGYITFTMKWNKANNPDKIKSEKKKAKFIKKLNKGIPYPGYPQEQYMKGKMAQVAPVPMAGQQTMVVQ